jgi:hypothetical protein
MQKILHCTIHDEELDAIAQVFVADENIYFLQDEGLLKPILRQGVVVFTRKEFRKIFPAFGLQYGAGYTLWKVPEDTFVAVGRQQEFLNLDKDLLQLLYKQQLELGRGHVYTHEWFDLFEHTPESVIEHKGKRYYLLTSEDWRIFTMSTKRRWILRWLQLSREDSPQGIDGLPQELYQPNLLKEYVGRFATRSGPNCFAAALSMAVAMNAECSDVPRQLIQLWMHDGPFFRLLFAHGFDKAFECRTIEHMCLAEPGDVLVWRNGEEKPIHAAFKVSADVVFEKSGQYWFQPWQFTRIHDIWYNDILNEGGYVEVYRQSSAMKPPTW